MRPDDDITQCEQAHRIVLAVTHCLCVPHLVSSSPSPVTPRGVIVSHGVARARRAEHRTRRRLRPHTRRVTQAGEAAALDSARYTMRDASVVELTRVDRAVSSSLAHRFLTPIASHCAVRTPLDTRSWLQSSTPSFIVPCLLRSPAFLACRSMASSVSVQSPPFHSTWRDRLPGPLPDLLKRLETTLEGNACTLVIVVLTIIALFMDDLRVWAFPPSQDSGFFIFSQSARDTSTRTESCMSHGT
jgi:hypothetical protein